MLASKSHRIELIACIAVLGGCMKIYPDPELPDIEVEWFESDCLEGPSDVRVTLLGVDDATLTQERTVACSTLKTVFEDLARERYMLHGSLLDENGQEYNRSQYDSEIDLRNGFDERTELYFGGASNFRADWTFDMGASCASLGADYVQIEFLLEDEPVYGESRPCQLTPMFGFASPGVFTVTAKAFAGPTTVAISTPLTGVTIDFDAFANLGTFVLTPCGADCP